MGNYKDYIPRGGFLVRPDLEIKTSNGTTRTYYKRCAVSFYQGSYQALKVASSSSFRSIVDAREAYNPAKTYTKNSEVLIKEIGIVFKATRDIPLNTHPLGDNSDENNLPFWVEWDTDIALSAFDASESTMLESTHNGIKISIDVLEKDFAYYIKSKQYIEHISILGIKQTKDEYNNVDAFVHIYDENLMSIVKNGSITDQKDLKALYEAATIDSFEIDLRYRDRISFSTPKLVDISQITIPPNIPIQQSRKIKIKMDIYIETWKNVTGYPPNNILGESISHIAASNGIQIGLISTGKVLNMGTTLADVNVGRIVERETEATLLKRRVVKKITESFRCDILVDTPEEHLKADYFFRIATETSHIIHAGIPQYDWKFCFGVIDGNSPIMPKGKNALTVNGVGVGFFATDPIKTQTVTLGWQ